MFGAVNTLRFSVCICAVSALAIGWAVTPQAAADDETGASPPGYLSLDHLDAYLEFRAEYSDTWVKSRDYRTYQPFATDRSQKNREWGFEERVGLEFGGVLIDPQFITFRTDFSFALTQDHYEEEIGGFEQTDSDDGHLLQYDSRINFFQGKAIAGSVYGRRHDDRINRRFQSTLDERRTGFGTSWVFAHDTIPMELSYDYLDTDRTNNRDRRDDEHFLERTFHYGFDWLISDHERFEFSYEHAETKQEYQGSLQGFDTDRDLFIMEHDLEFGSEDQHSLRTLIHWQEESGDLARDLFEIGPQLTLKHSDTFQTMYKYQFNRERYEGLDVKTHRADFQFIHQAYTNLTTTFDLFGLREDIKGDIDTCQYGASIDWQYNRRNPLGHLYANLAWAYDTEEVDGGDGLRLMLDEAGTFRDPVSVVLRNRNVVRGGIVVTDATNRRIYQDGLDYLVVRQGNATRLVRLQTGRIVDGDTVLVDYQYRVPADGQLDTIRADFSLEQRFTGGFTPYYRFSYRNQEDEASFGFASRADRTDHHRLGVTYEQKRYTLGAEYEIFDDTIEPYDAFHVNGLLHVLQSPNQNLDLSSRVSRLFFEGGLDDRDVTMVDVGLDHRWRLTESWSTIERLAYRFEDDSVAGDTQGWDATAGLEYNVGDISGELTLEYDRLELPESDEEDFGVYFRLRKDIPNVLGKW